MNYSVIDCFGPPKILVFHFFEKKFYMTLFLLSLYLFSYKILYDTFILYEQDLILWNAMITGYSQHGHGIQSLRLFEKMLLKGTRPDAVTYIGVLTACTHAGLGEEGRRYFHSMSHEHHIMP